VAEHSFYTALFALFIGQELLAQDSITVGRLELYDVLARCLLHDLDEAFSGDVSRMFKHDNAEVLKVLSQAAESYLGRACSTLAPGDVDTAQRIFKFWRTSKDATLLGRIVTFADYLSVLSYVVQEVRAGNLSVLHDRPLQDYHAQFLGEDYDFIRPWVDVASKLLAWLQRTAIERKDYDDGWNDSPSSP
jgi:5'-deoxynucleotidase YfbR-like HD superfamily hydrolase